MKRIIFEPTGEMRPPQEGEFFLHSTNAFSFIKAPYNFDTPREIYTMREEEYVWKPKLGEIYWTVNFLVEDCARDLIWRDDAPDNRLLKAGLVFRTKEEAQARAKKMLEAK